MNWWYCGQRFVWRTTTGWPKEPKSVNRIHSRVNTHAPFEWIVMCSFVGGASGYRAVVTVHAKWDCLVVKPYLFWVRKKIIHSWNRPNYCAGPPTLIVSSGPGWMSTDFSTVVSMSILDQYMVYDWSVAAGLSVVRGFSEKLYKYVFLDFLRSVLAANLAKGEESGG
jgi:hypothetical protein